MIECIFTLDYEVYGDGHGSLRELVYEPTVQLQRLFREENVKFVTFVEAVELQRIEAQQSDPAIDAVRGQVRDLHREGFEVALHLHPQWCNAAWVDGQWILDYSEYNLCTLPRARIECIVDSALAYLREVVRDAGFTPRAFRAGNWLFQPTETAAAVLTERGIRIDSSVFKGGVQRRFGLDYRAAKRNGFYWTFLDDVNYPHPDGRLLEIPIFTALVPFWKMLTTKRVRIQNRSHSTGQVHHRARRRLLDDMSLRYPMKFDFCRMTLEELKATVRKVVRLDRQQPASFKPLVAIGHTKDLMDLETIGAFLSYLKDEGIAVSTFDGIQGKCKPVV